MTQEDPSLGKTVSQAGRRRAIVRFLLFGILTSTIVILLLWLWLNFIFYPRFGDPVVLRHQKISGHDVQLIEREYRTIDAPYYPRYFLEISDMNSSELIYESELEPGVVPDLYVVENRVYLVYGESKIWHAYHLGTRQAWPGVGRIPKWMDRDLMLTQYGYPSR